LWTVRDSNLHECKVAINGASRPVFFLLEVARRGVGFWGSRMLRMQYVNKRCMGFVVGVCILYHFHDIFGLMVCDSNLHGCKVAINSVSLQVFFVRNWRAEVLDRLDHVPGCGIPTGVAWVARWRFAITFWLFRCFYFFDGAWFRFSWAQSCHPLRIAARAFLFGSGASRHRVFGIACPNVVFQQVLHGWRGGCLQFRFDHFHISGCLMACGSGFHQFKVAINCVSQRMVFEMAARWLHVLSGFNF